MTKNWFSYSVGVILLTTGTAKIVSALGQAAILRRIDPIVHVQFSHLMFIVGILELIVACICFISKLKILGNVLTAWLATNFLIYRMALWWIGWQRPCHCLGDFTDALHINAQTADLIMKIVLVYLLAGSYAGLFCFWRRKWKVVLAHAPSDISAPSSPVM